VVSVGSYLLSAALLALLALSLGFSAVRLRRRLIPDWEGAPAHLVEAIVAVALLIWLSELLGVLQLFYAAILVASSTALAGAIALLVRDRNDSPAGGAVGGSPAATGPAGHWLLSVIVVGTIAIVFAHWGLTTKDALDRGIFNFDSLWYHMPFATEFAHSHSVTGFHHPDTVFTNWFYPQNSELLHAVGILLTHRDTLSLFLNFGWLAISFLAAWCIGRPYGRGHLCVLAAAILLECHTLVVREPGAAKNDLMAAALLLAAIAILVNAWAARSEEGGASRRGPLLPGWPLAAAGLAVGLAAGTKSTALAIATALTVAVLALAPAGRRTAAFAWWAAAALAGGGYWYLRNLIASGNPLPQATSLGPISLPHPERLQTGRPDFNIVHYATDTRVWDDYFAPGLHQAFGLLWPLVIAAAAAGGLLAVLRGRQPVLRWMGGVALFGLLAYLFTPLSAAGAEGAPTAFGINIRYAIPALLAGLVLLPLGDGPRALQTGERSALGRWEWAFVMALLLVFVVTDRSDAVLRDPARLFGLLVAVLAVLLPAALLLAARRGAPRSLVVTGAAALALLVAAIGYPVQRHYLHDRFAAGSELPGMELDSAYGWARDVSGARIGLVGTSAGFLQYGFYGTDLSNEVEYLGQEGPHGAFNAIPDCHAFRAAVNAARLDYLVTAPFLNFIHPDEPVRSPEAGWLRGEKKAVKPILESGPVTVWRVRGMLDPQACGPRNTPLREVPDQPHPERG
jgi:hypothetical protein